MPKFDYDAYLAELDASVARRNAYRAKHDLHAPGDCKLPNGDDCPKCDYF